jgi:hypothetical protein
LKWETTASERYVTGVRVPDLNNQRRKIATAWLKQHLKMHLDANNIDGAGNTGFQMDIVNYKRDNSNVAAQSLIAELPVHSRESLRR